MMPDGDPSVFTRGFYGCEAEEVAEVVLLTPIDGLQRPSRAVPRA